MSKLRTQLTPQFAKSAGGAAGSASRQASAARGPGGFTITELTIATAVFSGVVLLGIVGFMQIGRIFYRGVTVGNTREAASNILDAVSSDIRVSSAYGTGTFEPTTPDGTNSPWPVYCAGSHIYIASQHHDQVNLSDHNLSYKFGLLQADLSSGPGSCSEFDPILPSELGTKYQNPKEMLGDGMRLSNFTVLSNGAVFNIDLTLTYGAANTFENDNPVSSDPKCRSILTGNQFCAAIMLNATVSPRAYSGS